MNIEIEFVGNAMQVRVDGVIAKAFTVTTGRLGSVGNMRIELPTYSKPVIEEIQHSVVAMSNQEGEQDIPPRKGTGLPKPPLGLKPRYIHDDARITDITSAMSRFAEVTKEIPSAWLEELSDLTRYKHQRNNSDDDDGSDE